MQKIKRREFLKASVSTTVALGTPWLFTSCKDKKSVQEPSQEINAQVAAIRGDNLDSITRDAIDALGGIQTVVNKGETVFIKPNFVSFPWAQYNNCFHIGECTKPEIIIAVTEECLKAGAGEVIIGDGSHLPTFEWQYAITLDGSTNLVKETERLGSWAIIASTDIMAVDATATRIMSHDTNKVKHLTMGFDMGLGEIQEQSIEILGEKLDNLRVTWKSARLKG